MEQTVVTAPALRPVPDRSINGHYRNSREWFRKWRGRNFRLFTTWKDDCNLALHVRNPESVNPKYPSAPRYVVLHFSCAHEGNRPTPFGPDVTANIAKVNAGGDRVVMHFLVETGLHESAVQQLTPAILKALGESMEPEPLAG